MPINTKPGYVEIGTSVQSGDDGWVLSNSLWIPAPQTIPSGDKRRVQTDNTAAGTVVAQEIGDTTYISTFSWDFIKARDYWRINRWFRDHGYFFYMRYFSHTDGAVKIRKFYREDGKEATPGAMQEVIDGITVPAYYKNFNFRVRDFGLGDISSQEVNIDD